MSENYIKVDGEPDGFEGGAVRYSKKGKGRFDLIPPEVVYLLIGYGELRFAKQDVVDISKADILRDAYIDDPKRYIETVVDMVIYQWAPSEIIDNKFNIKRVRYDDFLYGLCLMLKDLALHYEFGAEKYGVDNWKNGIPLTGGERGGSFTDSGLRHLNQYLLLEDDEKHDVSCVWNFVNAIYLQIHETKSEDPVVHQNIKDVIGDADPYEFGD